MYRFLKNTLRSTNNIIEIIVYFFGISIVAVIVTALTLSAVTRYISGNGYDWFIELPPILISWLVFPLLGPILKNGQHIQVDFLTAVLARRSILTLKLLNNFVVFIGAILFFIITEVESEFDSKNIVPIPFNPPYFSILG